MKDDREKSSGPFVVDPSIPKWLCQNCRHPLSVVGAESYAQKFGAGPSTSGVQASSVHGGKAMDQSSVVLPATANSLYRNRNSPEGGSLPFPNVVGDSSSALQTNSAINNSSRTVHGGKAMDQSFMVLPATATSVYRSGNTPEGDSLPFPNVVGDSSSALQTNSAINNSSRTVLKRAFDIVSSQTQVEQPLCLECMRVLSENIARELEDINWDTKAYEVCLKQLEEESPSGLSGANFLQEKEKVEEKEKKLKAAIVEIEKQCMDFTHQLQELELKSKRFEEREERFWHEFNDYSLQLTTHQEERDAILAKIEVTQTQLEQLKHTNVLNDAFRISYDGDFGTINNFRLGRLPKISVEWDEINAAWGQVCLLLHTMAMHSGANFSYRIIPMGSYPTILDSQNNKYELFGPVNQFWSTHYDKAMTLFLICLKEFGDYASEKDRAANVPPEKCFKFPKKIENDKVGDLTIHQSFNTTENWAKALKYMLCDLKWALHWFVAHCDFKCPGNVAMASGSSSLHSTDNSLT